MVIRSMLVVMGALACTGGEGADRSYCEAVCDWAAQCAVADRGVDYDAEYQECLAATTASDPSCQEDGNGLLSAVEGEALQPCLNAIDQKIDNGECQVFTGTPAEVLSGTAPAECVTQGQDAIDTFEEAQTATAETNEEMCNRFATTFCSRTEECLLGDFGGAIPQAALDAVGQPLDLCIQAMAPAFTNDCVASDRYAPEQGVTDVNTARQAARACMTDVVEVACGDLTDPQALPKECAASQSDPADLLAVAEVVANVVAQYADFL